MASLPAPEKRKWFYLGLRHVRMAHRLRRASYLDGAVFHAYHGFECMLSALIAGKGYPVPPRGWTSLELPSGETIQAYPSPLGAIRDRNAHTARPVFFDQLADRAQPYYTPRHDILDTYLHSGMAQRQSTCQVICCANRVRAAGQTGLAAR